MSDFMISLQYLWQGMLGLFVVMGVIAILVYALTKFGGKKK